MTELLRRVAELSALPDEVCARLHGAREVVDAQQVQIALDRFAVTLTARLQELARERQVEMDRLRWELEQVNEREAARSKVNLLQDEVRNFKSASQHKMLQIEMSQLREREEALQRRVSSK